MKRYCLALDLKDDPKLIAEYKEYHKKVWPVVIESIKKSGIIDLEIYCISDRLFMIMEVDDSFSFERKQKMDTENLQVQEWETLMSKYQKALPIAKKGEKWVLMEQLYKL